VVENEILDPLDRIVRSGDHHGISTLQGTRRFPQPTVRKEVAVQTGPHGVNQNDVEITMDSSMLEPVIENEHIEGSRIVMKHLSCDTDSISTDQKRESWMSKSILSRLVGTSGSIGSIAAQGYRGAGPSLLKGSGEMTADRGFPGTPDGQVAH
jgi:hypothetical protein